MRSKLDIGRFIRPASLLVSILARTPAFAEDTRPNELDVLISDQVVYDDNLFRQSAESSLTGTDGTKLHRADWINSTTLGVLGFWNLGRQNLNLKASMDDNHYRE